MTGDSKPTKSLAEQIAELDDPTPKDFDPENHHTFRDYHDEESDDSGRDNGFDGREHYEVVGKGKLRKAEELELGKEYEGLTVSRNHLNADQSDESSFDNDAGEIEGDKSEQDKYDDPDDAVPAVDDDLVDDEEINSDEAFGPSDDDLQKRFNFAGSSTAKETPYILSTGHDTASEDDRSSINNGRGSRHHMDDMEADLDRKGSASSGSTKGTDEDSEGLDSDKPDDFGSGNSHRKGDRMALRQLMASDQKSVAATISQAAKADAAKGQAVKTQRAGFDSLLNTRIKLQKGLVSMNSLQKKKTEAAEIVKVAEEAEIAATRLWSTLEELRQDLANTHTTGQKRKRITLSSSSDDLWARMNSLESSAMPIRRSVLNKWSSKVQAARPSDLRGKLLPQGEPQSITTMIDTQLATDTSRLVKRTQISRSDQGQLSSQNGTSSANASSIFDDTDFYQLLLRELVEQRMDSSGIRAGSIPIASSLRATKVKRNVDAKASKGRKMRYTIHEKLQNFMAPEDRGTWTETARDEFFASLLGGSAGKTLLEDEQNSDEEDQEIKALRLFRT